MITNFKDQPLQAQVSNGLREVDKTVWFCHSATLTFVLQSLYLTVVAGVRGWPLVDVVTPHGLPGFSAKPWLSLWGVAEAAAGFDPDCMNTRGRVLWNHLLLGTAAGWKRQDSAPTLQAMGKVCASSMSFVIHWERHMEMHCDGSSPWSKGYFSLFVWWTRVRRLMPGHWNQWVPTRTQPPQKY